MNADTADTGPAIRKHVDVTPQPTVVRLDHLNAADARWITDSYFVTEETEGHLAALRALFAKQSGSGIFLIGHYGSGKSHFLAWLTQQLRSKTFTSQNPGVLAVSLLNYRAAQSLESIVEKELEIPAGQQDRRTTWKKILRRYPTGLLVLMDELSEFLRSKASPQEFNEDLRFLQFLAEWAGGHRLWILAALQEAIEHTGEIEYDLFRKIKDRYPVRLLLTPSHVRGLIANKILRKKPSYQPAVEALARDLKQVYPETAIDYAELCEVYPIHPATLGLLNEVRDRFSQARGIVDFTLTQLLGNDARRIPAFLDRPWGDLLTPDAIVDHFADLFEIQPEFLPIAQKVLPYFRDQIPKLHPNRTQQELAWRLVKLLVLVHLSPRREFLDAEDAAPWLLFKVSSIDPQKNRAVVRKALETLARQGSYVKQEGSRFHLDLEDDSKEFLDQLLAKTLEDIGGRGDSIFETLVPCLQGSEFHPFSMPRDRWHSRRLKWHFHDWDLQVYFGGGVPPEPKGLALQVGLPWGPAAEGACHRVQPRPIEADADILELAALQQLAGRPLPAQVQHRIQERLKARAPRFASLVRAAYAEAAVLDATGERAAAPLQPLHGGHVAWLNTLGEWLLRRTYPQFERFAPVSGPLPKDAYRQFMRFAAEHDPGSPDAPDAVKLIREAYLVPMGLMQRKGAEYVMNPKLDGNELVRHLAPILEHHPSPARVYEHMSAPVYGLVSDQIHLLLIVLLLQGEIDIVKGENSYREAYETLTSPLQYDRVLPGQALSVNQLRMLQTLCEGFRIQAPRQWTVLAQKRAVQHLRKYGSRERDQLSSFVVRLKEYGEVGDIVTQVEDLVLMWVELEKGDHELQGFQHFERVIGSAHKFVVLSHEIGSLPQRFERLLRETQRFRHLFSDPAVASCADADIASGVEGLGPAPPLSQPEAVEGWLERAATLYQRYQQWYRNRHEQWREHVDRHPVWSYRLPPLARSRHLMAGKLLEELEAMPSKARRLRCSGLTSLEFHPACRCGFDGSDGPVSAVLQQFEDASRRLDQEIALFFQQEKVKSKVREWVDQGLETRTGALSYLEGKSACPDVDNISLFDQHLSGLELVKPVQAESLLELIGGRVWEKPALMRELDQFFARAGPRITIRRDEPQPRNELVAWCYEQALALGRPLPKSFSRAEQALAARQIEPKWVSDAALQKLEDMGLGEDVLLRIMEMMLDGLVRLPETLPAAGPAAAAAELLNPSRPCNSAELEALVSLLYTQHPRFVKLRRQPWLARLDNLANAALQQQPRSLESVLREHAAAQWVVVDCLGLPLARIVRTMLQEAFSRCEVQALDSALVSERTSTEAFYTALLAEDFKKPFEKIDAVDGLVHERRLDLPELARLARAELEIAFRRLSPRLDPSLPVLVFGDHGFRLAPDGNGFVHGGPSTLERLTPLFLLV